MTLAELLSAALRYAELGYRVFPCTPSGKAPLTEHAFHDSTADVEENERWWTQHPNANIGIPTAGLMVIDIDGEANPWPGDTERSANLAIGAMGLTPRGGRHYLFHRRASRGVAPNRTWRPTSIPAPTAATSSFPPRWSKGVPTAGHPAWNSTTRRTVSPSRRRGWSRCSTSWPRKLPRRPTSRPAGGQANPIPEGQRNETLARLGGTMRRVGMTLAEIAALLQTNKNRHFPPLSPCETERIGTSTAGYEHTEGPTWGVLGEARVHVLRLNRALDRLCRTSAPR